MPVSDINHLRVVLHDIATYANHLALGLQNAAPAAAHPGQSVQYLKEIAIELEKINKKIAEL